jgi:predicted aspartyl protease
MPGPFPYLDNFVGPTAAPVCRLRVSWNGRSDTVEGVIDTGASWTVIPKELAIRLGLKIVAQGIINGVAGSKESNKYIANLEFAGLSLPRHLIFDFEKPFALIGREILNKYISTFDGPQRQFSIENP